VILLADAVAKHPSILRPNPTHWSSASSNEKEISHDMVSLASSNGYTFSVVARDRFAENSKSGIKPHHLEPAGLLSRGIARNE
jgi:hypothetical protein